MIELHLGDCLEILSAMPEMSVDAIVTDPPYGLSFMGKKWDYDVPDEVVWRECLRVLKPGGHLLCFAGTRTQHRMAVRIEDAGFEIRDMIAWVYGSGFPKSADVSKAIDKAAGAEREVVGVSPYFCAGRNHDNFGVAGDGITGQRDRSLTAPATPAAKQWDGWGTALKPALEPITVARKPLEGTVAANVQKYGTGAMNIDASRVEIAGDPFKDGFRKGDYTFKNESRACWNLNEDGDPYRKDPHPLGRWPANLIHDGSEEVVELFPEAAPAKAANRGLQHSGRHGGLADIGGNAARFFFRAEHEKEDLLFCRARAILSAWKLTKADQLCSQENASVAELSLCLSRQAAVSVLSDAVIAVSRGDKLLSDVRELSMTVTEIELERLCETLITAMLISESVALPAPSQDALIQNGCRVSVAAIQKPTDTMTITISLPTSGGYAEPVTFSIIPNSMAHGAKDLSADRFRYCAKASKADRDEGLESGLQWIDSLELIWYDNTLNLISEVFLWECQGQNQSMGLSGEALPLKVILGDMMQEPKDKDLPMLSHGKQRMVKYLKAIKFTTLTGIKKTIELKILNFLNLLPTSEYTEDAIKTITGSGLSLVESVALKNLLKLIITKEKTEYHLGASNAAKITQQKTNAKDELKRLCSRNTHSTVKPTDLMRYLCRLVTPPGGIVLDPFMGSGSTGKAAMLEGFNFIGIEREPEYMEIAKARIHAAIPTDNATVYEQLSLRYL